MLQENSRLFDIGGYIDAAICHQKFRQLLLHFCTGSIDIQNRDHHGIFFCHFLNKRNRIFQRISLYANQDHIWLFCIILHIGSFYRDRLSGLIPHFFQSQSFCLHLLQMCASGNQCHILSGFCHVITHNAAGSPCANNQILHVLTPSSHVSHLHSVNIRHILYSIR